MSFRVIYIIIHMSNPNSKSLDILSDGPVKRYFKAWCNLTVSIQYNHNPKMQHRSGKYWVSLVAFLHISSCIYYLSQRKTTYRQRFKYIAKAGWTLCNFNITDAHFTSRILSIIIIRRLLLGLPNGNRQLARGLFVSLGGLRSGEGVLCLR